MINKLILKTIVSECSIVLALCQAKLRKRHAALKMIFKVVNL